MKKIVAILIMVVAVVVAGVGSYHAHDYHMYTRPASELHGTPEKIPQAVHTGFCEVTAADMASLTQEMPSEACPTCDDILALEELANEQVWTDPIPIPEETFLNLTFEEQDLLERVAMAEAEGEDTVGKALVMLAVLNRAEILNMPIGEVIYAPSQFCTDRMYIQPTDDCHEALAMVMDGWNETMLETEEDWDRTKRVFYFGRDEYPRYGEPAFKYGGHYFSVR